MEEDNAETEIVPACVVSPLSPALGFSYFEVTIGDVDRDITQLQQATKPSSAGAPAQTATAGAAAGPAAAAAGITPGAPGQKGTAAASGPSGAAAAAVAKPPDGPTKPEVLGGGAKYEPLNISVGLGMDKATYDVPPGLRENTFGYSSINGYK